jgi:hypothetical protein
MYYHCYVQPLVVGCCLLAAAGRPGRRADESARLSGGEIDRARILERFVGLGGGKQAAVWRKKGGEHSARGRPGDCGREEDDGKAAAQQADRDAC